MTRSPIPEAALAAGWTQADWDREFRGWRANGTDPRKAAAMREGYAKSTFGPVSRLHEAVAAEWHLIAEGHRN